MRFLLLAALALAGCKQKPAPFCAQDLSGLWLNSSDRHFAYRFRDHGEVVRGEYLERTDARELRNPSDPVLFELHRTEGALAGVMKMTLDLPSGRKCPFEFGIKMSSCQPEALQAVVEMAADVNEDCSRKPGEPSLVEYRFERDDSLDGGPRGPRSGP